MHNLGLIRLQESYSVLGMITQTSLNRNMVLKEHLKIVKYIREGKALEVETLTRKHVQKAKNAYENSVKSNYLHASYLRKT